MAKQKELLSLHCLRLNVGETCELIGLFLLYELKRTADKSDIDC